MLTATLLISAIGIILSSWLFYKVGQPVSGYVPTEAERIVIREDEELLIKIPFRCHEVSDRVCGKCLSFTEFVCPKCQGISIPIHGMAFASLGFYPYSVELTKPLPKELKLSLLKKLKPEDYKNYLAVQKLRS